LQQGQNLIEELEFLGIGWLPVMDELDPLEIEKPR
jgi:hypothetical protein